MSACTYERLCDRENRETVRVLYSFLPLSMLRRNSVADSVFGFVLPGGFYVFAFSMPLGSLGGLFLVFFFIFGGLVRPTTDCSDRLSH